MCHGGVVTATDNHIRDTRFIYYTYSEILCPGNRSSDTSTAVVKLLYNIISLFTVDRTATPKTIDALLLRITLKTRARSKASCRRPRRFVRRTFTSQETRRRFCFLVRPRATVSRTSGETYVTYGVKNI